MSYSVVSLRMKLSDLAKYSMTRRVAQSLCDSWASCIHNYSLDDFRSHEFYL